MVSPNKIRIVHSQANNPWHNLALEEYLLKKVGEGEVILYLWQNDRTVVIGRNQNAWKECRCKKLEDRDNGCLARRLSGGGAVYHDLGNLNFTFIMDRELYDLDFQLNIILEAVRNLGIEARFSGRNDLVIGERKFSGNAFYFSKDSAYHHGTILLDTDFTKMLEYLQVSEDKIRSKGVDSVRSRVVNLKEIKPDITLSLIKSALSQSFAANYKNTEKKVEEKRYNPVRMEVLKDLYDKYSSWDWRYGNTPNFDIDLENRFDWGGVEIGLSLEQGVIKEVKIYSDAMDVDLINDLTELLKGIPYRSKEIKQGINKLEKKESYFKYTDTSDYSRKVVVNDLKNWLI